MYVFGMAPDEFLFKSLYYNDLNKNIANKLKENL